MLLLLLLQVLASCLWLGRSEVVTSFQSCLRFFFRKTPPNDALKPNNPAWICQLYNNEYHFATLYNRDLHIPVYSAYIYQPGPGPRPHIWMVEPQLIGSNYSNSMMKQDELIRIFNVTLEEIMKSQAVSKDYMNLNGVHAGRLNPSAHQANDMRKEATFTLTNMVPQNSKLNVGAWRNYEQNTMTTKTKGCITTYVVVGTVPGNTNIAKGRVNKPSYLWSSACCEMGNNQMKAWAVIADNENGVIQSLTLGDLEDRLTDLYGQSQVSLFHKDCPRQ